MKKIFTYSTIVKWIFLLSVLGLLVLWSTYRSQAQDLDSGDLNDPIHESSSAPGSLFTYPSGEVNSPQLGQTLADIGTGQTEANLPGEINATAPDLVITDPNTDVVAQIERLTGVTAAHSLIIPAADFTVDGNSRTWFFGFNSSYLYPTSASGYCGITPLYLPQGATITSFGAYIFDNDASYDVSVSLLAKEIGTTTTAPSIAGVVSSGQNVVIQLLTDTTIQQATIDNTSYTYHIGVCMWGANNTSRFYAAQIFYNK
jgi:hypothetical protein